MNIKKFNKIVIVSLCDNKSKSVGKVLSQTLDMMFCDAKELMEYQLIDRQALKEFCTPEYLLAQEKRVFKDIASYENVVVAISFDYFQHNKELFKDNSIVVFLKFSQEFCKVNASKPNFIAHKQHSKEMQDVADISFAIRNADDNFICKNIIKHLGGLI